VQGNITEALPDANATMPMMNDTMVSLPRAARLLAALLHGCC
jgi:hypothetical protein